MQKWFPEFFDRFGALTVFDLLIDYIKTGRIKLDGSKIDAKIVYHDPCNYGRKSQEMFGHGYFAEPRWILDQFVPDWVDMYPSKGNQYCCGGGGGTLLTPFKEERTRYAERKMSQIKRSGATMLVVPCHSCHGQIKAMAKEYDMPGIQVKYLWEVVADILVVEGSEEE